MKTKAYTALLEEIDRGQYSSLPPSTRWHAYLAWNYFPLYLTREQAFARLNVDCGVVIDMVSAAKLMIRVVEVEIDLSMQTMSTTALGHRKAICLGWSYDYLEDDPEQVATCLGHVDPSSFCDEPYRSGNGQYDLISMAHPITWSPLDVLAAQAE